VKRVLFVDDEPKILEGIGRMLRADRNRWDMQFALSGEAALQVFEASSFDVVISDLRMPGKETWRKGASHLEKAALGC
jgi:YesN/AraC family two-component response regulator